ncbi:hypothetical protein RV00_GL002061 [Enterococcus devriesei]|uniref:Uncharacterized protein n=1 Tax=Enterococcus devriesei TaxID=319970 RepID=A0A1L8SUZ6_9ENTE|nr:hypothetical protein RV00_GL002061 [Enterococcus devriesei]
MKVISKNPTYKSSFVNKILLKNDHFRFGAIIFGLNSPP